MAESTEKLAEDVRQRLFPELRAGQFAPQSNWADLGQLIVALEADGMYLMTNSAVAPALKRIAAFHRSTATGFPCAGSSEWGPFASHGEAVLRAAHAALFSRRS
jgi:hypothetical protein